MNKLALITGSTRGIGFEVARQLAAREHTVIVTGRRQDAAEKAARSIAGNAMAHALDMSDAASIRAIAEWIAKEAGQLDVLVNNAAILLDEGENILQTSAETVEGTMRTNALGPLLMAQAVRRCCGGVRPRGW